MPKLDILSQMDFYFIQSVTLLLLGFWAISFLFSRNSLRHKKELSVILEKNECPKCGLLSVDTSPFFVIDKSKGSGCSGTSTMNVECKKCRYSESFTISSNQSC